MSVLFVIDTAAPASPPINVGGISQYKQCQPMHDRAGGREFSPQSQTYGISGVGRCFFPHKSAQLRRIMKEVELVYHYYHQQH